MAVALIALIAAGLFPVKSRFAGDGSEIGPLVAAAVMRQLPALVQSRV